MAKITIAQLREKALVEFNANYIHDVAKAKNLVNRFYRLSALEYYVCLLENDAKMHDTQHTEEQRAKADKMHDRLNEDLKQFGLHLAYYGIYPRLEENNGTQREALTTWYYSK